MEVKRLDFSREKVLMKRKMYAATILLHSFLRWVDFYFDEIFWFMSIGAVIHISILSLEMKRPRLANSIKAIYVGLIPPSILFAMPYYAASTVPMQFMCLNYGLTELNWDQMPFLFGSNILGWISGYFYHKNHASNDPAILSVKKFFEDDSFINQMLVGFLLNYFGLILQSVDKYTHLKLQKEYETKLLQLNADLEIANAKLQKSNTELQEALQEKENFILRFSHEIRNPLNSLLGNIELCYEQVYDKELEQMLKDAKVSGEILLQLLNNVLDTAKVAVGRLEVSLTIQSIREFLEGSWIVCSEIIRKKKLYGCLSVNLNVPELLEFDRHRLMQILINTVSNASKFTDHGSVKIHVDFIAGSELKREDMQPKYGIFLQSSTREVIDLNADEFNEKPKNIIENLTLTHKKFRASRVGFPQDENRSVEIPLFKGKFIDKNEDELIHSRKTESFARKPTQSPKEGYIRFEIVDSGCGISPEYLEKAFQKFQQVNNSTSKRQIGTGLGLWITKEIIEMMKGDIDIFSKPNIGTTIVIMVKTKAIPFSASNQSPQSLALASQKKSFTLPPSISGRVLIAEDIPYNQELNQKFLTKCGVDVQNITIANNGQEAVDFFLTLGSQYFDLILMDIDMPVMDGKTATKIIRQEEEKRGWQPANIVFLTGFSESKMQSELLDEHGEYRANGFHSKPASVETFRRIVNGFMHSGKGVHKNFAEGLLVLVVDDDSMNLTMIIKMLKLCNINTLEAQNGQEAIQVYEQNWKSLTCILMDCDMPVLDGLEATRRILAKHAQRAAILGKSLNIYGLTGHVGEEYRQRCFESGMKDVLKKPIKIETLYTVLGDK